MSDQEYVTVERYKKLVAHVNRLTENLNELTKSYNALLERMDYIDRQWDLITGVNDAIRRGESLQAKKAREKRDLARAYAKAEKNG